MAGKMVSDCGESRQGTASCGHDGYQETCSRDGQSRACQARSGAGEAQEGRGEDCRDWGTARSRADPLRRLAVQRQSDGLLVMTPGKEIFHPDFKAAPWWWEAWKPNNALSQDPPPKTDVAIVGAGYGGLSTSLELRRNGVGAVVLERGDFGVGASTRNGGMISGGVNMGKGLGGKSQAAEEFEAKKAAFLGAGADSLSVLEDIIAREKIECGVIKQGRFVGAWTPKHYAEQAAKVEMFNKYADVGAEMVPRERQREFIASDYYFGGMYARRSGHLHPALYYKGLLEAAHRAGATLCANVEAERIEKIANGWRVLSSKGPIECREVVI